MEGDDKLYSLNEQQGIIEQFEGPAVHPGAIALAQLVVLERGPAAVLEQAEAAAAGVAAAQDRPFAGQGLPEFKGPVQAQDRGVSDPAFASRAGAVPDALPGRVQAQNQD